MFETTNQKNVDELSVELKIQHNETVPINQLPVELFFLLFEYLDRNELFAYESVCEKWAYYVKAFVGQNLVIAKGSKVRPRDWFYLDTRCPPRSVIQCLDLIVPSNSFLFGLKQLKICDPTIKYNPTNETKPLLSSLTLINRLTTLEVLETSRISPVGTISLPNLRHLVINSIHQAESGCPGVLLDCPQLLSFKTKKMRIRHGVSAFDFSPRTRITQLYVDQYYDLETFKKLKSLQYLSAKCSESWHYEYPNLILSGFPNLKNFTLRPSSLLSFDKGAFVGLLKEKQALGRADLILTFASILIENVDKLGSHEDLFGSEYWQWLSTLYLKNYQSLYEPEMKYVKQFLYFEFEVPADFHEKFSQIRKLAVKTRVTDEDRLIKFIEGFRSLDSLRFERKAQLREPFFRKLVDCCSAIPYLSLWIEPHERATDQDFDFIFQFKNLARLTLCGQDLGDDLIRRVFDQFGSFELNYQTKDGIHHIKIDPIKVTRAKKGSEFEFSACSGHLETFGELDDFLEHIEKYCRSSYVYDFYCSEACANNICISCGYAENSRKPFFFEEREELYEFYA